MKTAVPTNTFARYSNKSNKHKPGKLSARQTAFAAHDTLDPKHRANVNNDFAKGALSQKLEAIRARGVNYAKSPNPPKSSIFSKFLKHK